MPKLTIIMPVFNEERTLGEIVDRVVASCGDIAEVVFIDDGSTDRSLQILQERARPCDTVISKKNGGKGSAVRMGIEKARGIYTIVQDADLEYDPSEIPIMLALAEKENLPVIFGSRRLTKQKQFAHISFYVGGVLLTYFFNLLYSTHLTDQTTCYKLIRTDILRNFIFHQNDFRFDVEETALLARAGYYIVEIPITYRPRTRAEGKKIGVHDWFLSIILTLTLRFTPGSALYRR